MRILFVVHRAYPYPGGSEIYVHKMACECSARGHSTWVLTDVHQGDQDGIHITDDREILSQHWDAVIVHGGDCSTQDFIHGQKLKAPVMYMIILPSNSPACTRGLENAKFLAWSTMADLEHITKHGQQAKAVYVRHGVDIKSLDSMPVDENFLLGGRRMVMSAGGFWSHKGFSELADTFNLLRPQNLVLCLYGYAQPEAAPAETTWVKTFYGQTNEQVLCAMYNSSFYILNSREEGFGLVLLEAMLLGTPWAARQVGGVTSEGMKNRGRIYNSREELVKIIQELDMGTFKYPDTLLNIQYVQNERSIANTVDDIERAFGWRA